MTRSRNSSVLLYIALCILVAIATWVRISPLLEGGDRLQRQFVTEDGYLMLTISRNMALGHGFSVSGGTIPSNGTQPLSALLYALCFYCTGADKMSGLYPIIAVQVLFSVLTALLIYVSVRRYLHRGGGTSTAALLAACVWYASPTSIMNTQNSLETGLWILLVLASVSLYDALSRRLQAGAAAKECVLLGIVLGVAFLARNDSCFLVAVLLGVHFVRGYRRGLFRRALLQVWVTGGVSLLVASPWLVYNTVNFGHPVPISGRAEALNSKVAGNLIPAFGAMVENLLLVLRIPSELQNNAYLGLAFGGVLLVLSGLIVWKRSWLAERFSAGVAILGGFVGALFLYYSLFFGMPSFLGRYFFPATVLCAIVMSAVVVAVYTRIRHPAARRILVLFGLAVAVACAGLDIRIYAGGRDHGHFQAVEWVAANVPDSTWVGAVQTGTLGYYHDRTINLDGKVDPYALVAREHNRIPDYAIERKVEYIVDWRPVATRWAVIPAFARNYELLVDDREHNLGVLRRRTDRTEGRISSNDGSEISALDAAPNEKADR